MKKYILILFLLITVFTACSLGDEESTLDITSSESIPSVTTSGSVPIQTSALMIEEDPYLFQSGELSKEKDGVTYMLKYPLGDTEPKEKDLIGFSSELSTVHIVRQFTGTKIKRVYFKKVDIPNTTVLSFAEGIKVLNTNAGIINAGSLEEIHLPASLDNIYFDDLPFPFPSLRAIHVAESSSSQVVSFRSHNGILYQRNQLVCVPQNHQTESGELVILESTHQLNRVSIYHCRNLQKVVIPDSVTTIKRRAIVATAEHPLTVVCSRGSAAAAYVEKYGKLYHLTVEYTD